MTDWMAGYSALLMCRLRDASFRYGRPALGWVAALGSLFALLIRQRRRAVTLMLAANRYTDCRRFVGLLTRNLDLISEQCAALCGDTVDLELLDRRCVVLAPPLYEGSMIARKGVLLVSFSETSGKLFISVNVDRLTRLFHIVLEPSSAGYADPSILCWLNIPESVIVQTTEMRDRVLLSRLSSNLIAVPYGAGDWIDLDRFFPSEVGSKRYDSVCVANFGWWKRVHAFLAAVSKARRVVPGYRAVLVLATHGYSPARDRELRRLLRHYQIEDAVEVVTSVGLEALRLIYAQSRILVFTSWKEGSSRVIFEAMSADTPVIVLERNVGVNKDYINPRTGRLVSDHDLGNVLIEEANSTRSYSPRQWYRNNCGPYNTTAKLAADLARAFPEERWTPNDLWVKTNAPEARYISSEHTSPPLSSWLTGPGS